MKDDRDQTSSTPPLTPVWCDRCAMWVPVEKEPHRGGPDAAVHYARDYPRREYTT